MSLAGAVCLLQFLVTVHFLSTNKITAVKLARYRIRQCIKELIVIKKINTTTNFNTGAIPCTKALHAAYISLRSAHQFFFSHASPKNPMLYNAFQQARHPAESALQCSLEPVD